MLEVILLIFLSRHIGKLAKQKGEKPTIWIILTVLLWIICEIIGAVIGIIIIGFDPSNILSLLFFSIFSAFGGYLIIRAILTNKPDADQRL